MYCQYCGAQIINDSDKFCQKCGNPIIQNTTELPRKKSDLKSSDVMKWTVICAVIIGVIWGVFYFNSATYLEKKLAKHTWYEKPYFETYGYVSGSIMEFHLNGDTEWTTYIKYNGKWEPYKNRSASWELMDDKTLYFNGNYYKWNDEWSLSGNTLKIGDKIYYSTKMGHYEED